MNARLQSAFLDQAHSCAALGSPFMARLMTLLALHWPDDSEVAKRFADWQGDIGATGAALPLRITGGLHALVLQGRDVALASAYPPNAADDATLEVAVLGALKRHDEFLCDWVKSAPQTNEVRRSAVLIAAAHWLDARYSLPFQMSELGASAGLNLNFDRFAMQIGDDLWGPCDATVRLSPEWRGPLPPLANPKIVERRGVDLNPLQMDHQGHALRLISYIWPDQSDRVTRTRAAMALPPPPVDNGDAIDWLAKRLEIPRHDHLHFIYNTIAWQYFPKDCQARGRTLVETAGAVATEDAPIAWLSMEADDNPNGAALTIRLWPGDIQLSLGRAGFHGQWVEWANNAVDC